MKQSRRGSPPDRRPQYHDHQRRRPSKCGPTTRSRRSTPAAAQNAFFCNIAQVPGGAPAASARLAAGGERPERASRGRAPHRLHDLAVEEVEAMQKAAPAHRAHTRSSAHSPAMGPSSHASSGLTAGLLCVTLLPHLTCRISRSAGVLRCKAHGAQHARACARMAARAWQRATQPLWPRTTRCASSTPRAKPRAINARARAASKVRAPSSTYDDPAAWCARALASGHPCVPLMLMSHGSRVPHGVPLRVSLLLVHYTNRL